jgi:hypothetical protein
MSPELWNLVLTHCVTGLTTCCAVSLGIILMAAFLRSQHDQQLQIIDAQIVERMTTLNNLNKRVKEYRERVSDEELQSTIDRKMSEEPKEIKYDKTTSD